MEVALRFLKIFLLKPLGFSRFKLSLPFGHVLFKELWWMLVLRNWLPYFLILRGTRVAEPTVPIVALGRPNIC